MTRFNMTSGNSFAIAAAIALGSIRSQAATPGAWETFSTQTNAKAWTVYDFSDEGYYIPTWDDSEPGFEYIKRYHSGDNALIFFADDQAGNEALIGDYVAANVGSISCEIYIEDLTEFYSTDCTVYADGPDGPTTYYSEQYFFDDFDASGWWKIKYSFDRPWFYYDADTEEYVQVADNESFLHNILELNFGFYPEIDSTLGMLSGLDEVKLEPRLEPSNLTTKVENGQFKLSFTKLPAVSYDLEKLSQAAPFTWSPVSGQAGQTSPGESLFSTPTNQGREIFHVVSEPVYTKIVTQP